MKRSNLRKATDIVRVIEKFENNLSQLATFKPENIQIQNDNFRLLQLPEDIGSTILALLTQRYIDEIAKLEEELETL